MPKPKLAKPTPKPKQDRTLRAYLKTGFQKLFDYHKGFIPLIEALPTLSSWKLDEAFEHCF